MLKPKTKEFACVREDLNFSRKDTQRWGFLLTFLTYSKKVKMVFLIECCQLDCCIFKC